MVGRYFVYARCSTELQDDSIARQQEVFEHWRTTNIEKLGGREYGGFYADSDTTAGIPFYQRPSGYQILANAKDGDLIVVTKFDRAFRSVQDFTNTSGHLLMQNIHLLILDQPVDSETPHGRLILNVMASVAEFERAIISARSLEALASMRRRNMAFNGIVVVGWKLVSRKSKQMVPDMEFRNYIRDIDNWIKANKDKIRSTSPAAYQLPPEFRINPRNGKPWDSRSLRENFLRMRKGWPPYSVYAAEDRRRKVKAKAVAHAFPLPLHTAPEAGKVLPLPFYQERGQPRSSGKRAP